MHSSSGQKKHLEVFAYIAVLISSLLAFSFLLILLYTLLHLFWDINIGFSFLNNQLAKISSLGFSDTSSKLQFIIVVLLALGTLIFSYSSWWFAHQLPIEKGSRLVKSGVNKHFHGKIVALILLIVLLIVGYFMFRFHFLI